MKKYMLTFLGFVLAAVVMQAQHSLTPTVIATTGGYQTSLSGSISSTAGEIMTETYTSGVSNYIITQGFQQPEKQVLGMEDAGADYQVEVFPNPVNDVLQVKLDTPQDASFSFSWIDMNGKAAGETLTFQVATGGQTISLNASALAAGTYVLTITSDGAYPVKTCRIIKY